MTNSTPGPVRRPAGRRARSRASSLRSTASRLMSRRDKPRELEHRVDQRTHVRDGLADPPEHLAARVVELIAVATHDGGTETIDRAQWSAKIVRDGVVERLELPEAAAMAAVGDVVCDREYRRRSRRRASRHGPSSTRKKCEPARTPSTSKCAASPLIAVRYRGSQKAHRSAENSSCSGLAADGLTPRPESGRAPPVASRQRRSRSKRSARARHACKRGQMRVHRCLFGGPVACVPIAPYSRQKS